LSAMIHPHQHLGIEIDLISDYELLEALELSGHLPMPEEQSIFALKNPMDWVLAGQEVRQAFREELPYQLSEMGSAFFLHVLQEYGEGLSELLADGYESELLEDLLAGPRFAIWLEYLNPKGWESTFRKVRGRAPFQFVYLPYDELLELDVDALPIWEDPETDAELIQANWLAKLSSAVAEAQLLAAEREGTPGLFLYPMVFPTEVYEVEEDEQPFKGVYQALRALRKIEKGEKVDKGELPDALRYQLMRYMARQVQLWQQTLDEWEYDTASLNPAEDSVEQQIASKYALPDFDGEAREWVLAIWKEILNRK